MQQTKEEYIKIREFARELRAGKFRYLPKEERARVMQKQLNQNRADKRLNSYTHNMRRFSTAQNPYATFIQYEQKERARKVARIVARCARKYGITRLSSLTLTTLTEEEERQITALMLRMAAAPPDNIGAQNQDREV